MRQRGCSYMFIKMATTRWRLLACCCLAYVAVVSPSQEIMKKLSTGFGKVLVECRDELNAGDHIMRDFENYWLEEYQLLNREFGCMVLCMAGKHKLLTSEGQGIHHDSAHEFAKKHGADDETAKQLASILTSCEVAAAAEAAGDTCLRALEVAKCFRTKIHALQWAPTLEQIIEEVLTDA